MKSIEKHENGFLKKTHFDVVRRHIPQNFPWTSDNVTRQLLWLHTLDLDLPALSAHRRRCHGDLDHNQVIIAVLEGQLVHRKTLLTTNLDSGRL